MCGIMIFPEQPSSACMLFHEKGDLLFANPGTLELTGFAAEGNLEDWLAKLFPRETDDGLASDLIRHATSQPIGPEPVRFVSEFSTASGQRRRGDFQLQLWEEESSGRHLLISFLAHQEAGSLSLETWSGFAEQVQERLEEALNCLGGLRKEDSRETLERLGRILSQGRDLLAIARRLDRFWSQDPQIPEQPMIPTRDKMPETRVNT
jgi:hypothetical protein